MDTNRPRKKATEQAQKPTLELAQSAPGVAAGAPLRLSLGVASFYSFAIMTSLADNEDSIGNG